MWQAISQEEFHTLLREQQAELTSEERAALDRYSVPVEKANIIRSERAGIENVFVVARSDEGVLYFDDIEYGFNVSPVDENNLITHPGGSQYTLSEAVRVWLMPAPGNAESTVDEAGRADKGDAAL